MRSGVLVQVAPADPGPNGWGQNIEPLTLLGESSWADVSVMATVTFSDAPAGGAPASALRLRKGEPAAVGPCTAASTRWIFDAVAPGYLSTSKPTPQTCLIVPRCNPDLALIYWDCVARVAVWLPDIHESPVSA